MKQKIGIMGGTFDPIHNGHLIIAQSAADEFDLDQVLFIPTGRSPHKDADEVTDGEKRCVMVQKAISENKKFQLSKIELKNTGTSYTFETLEKLSMKFRDATLYFIMGGDSLKDFEYWREPEQICRFATILAAVRDEIDGPDMDRYISHIKRKYHAKIYKLHSPNYSISSKEIRKRVHDGKSIRYMVPKQVEGFINRENLYLDI
ncbi:MAG: nicotinate-nucleotide adenylyltransferase [Lachnospiraceae bacterium]